MLNSGRIDENNLKGLLQSCRRQVHPGRAGRGDSRALVLESVLDNSHPFQSWMAGRGREGSH